MSTQTTVSSGYRDEMVTEDVSRTLVNSRPLEVCAWGEEVLTHVTLVLEVMF